MTDTARRGVRIVVGAAIVVGALAILRPWTVRPIQTSPSRAFDALAYVTEAWPRMIDEARRTAVGVEAARAAAAPHEAGPAPSPRRPVFVTATGVVTEVDRRSRVGVALVQAGAGPATRIAVQVGPVLRGTSLRDAISFVRFTDFSNQSEFAAVANAFNDRVLREVLAGLDLESLAGRTLTVTGVASLAGEGADRPIDVVPVTLSVAGGGR